MPDKHWAALACFAALALSAPAATAFAKDLTGRASVIDGDTIEIHGMRLYPDAVGTKSSFYTRVGDELWIGSQPLVLVDGIGVAVDQQTWSRFLASPSGHSWPAAATPYAGVSQLLPNHYLDLRSGKSRRFWPRKDVQHHSRDAAAKAMTDMLHGMIQALLAVYLPGRIKTAAKHPMLLATKLWAAAHLLTNGTMADVLLFGGFLAWAIADRISVNRRPARAVPALPARAANDAIALAGGLALYAVTLLWLHARLIGVSPLG